MVFIELGIDIDFRPLQSAKAHSPMLVTDSGMVTSVRLMQEMNAAALDRIGNVD